MNIHIGLGENCYILTGDIDLIKNKRQARSNFENCGADFSSEDKIVIQFYNEANPSDSDNAEKLSDNAEKLSDNAEKLYKAIIKLSDKFGINLAKSKQLKIFLNKIDQENLQFEVFSKKAENIRNNKHDGNDFKEFTNVVDSKLVRKLYGLQLLSAYHLAFAQNACNFSVPGSGKTSVVYGAYAYLKSLQPENSKFINRLLIISPLAAFGPWKDEYEECFGKKTSIKELVGITPSDRKSYYYSNSYTEITLISYHSASNDSDAKGIQDFLNNKNNKVMIVLDEAHRIKNVDGGKWAKEILPLGKYANSRVVLTGTPAPNSYTDLYNLYKFIWASKDIIQFPINYLQELSDDSSSPKAKKDVEKLVSRIAPFFIRVKKSDLRLPEPVFNDPLFVPMSEAQRKIYNDIEEKYINYFEDANGYTGFSSKLKRAKLIRLMQCITNPSLLNKPLEQHLSEEGLFNKLDIDDEAIIQLIKSYNSTQEIPPKFTKALELLKKIIHKEGPDGRVIIWSIFIQNFHDLKDFLNKNEVQCELLYGGIPVKKVNEDEPIRAEIIHDFHKEDCPYKVIIANPLAVGESISLHKACHNAIYLEKNFNAAMYMQSKDRIHRYGLKNDDIINYYYLLSEDSIDQVIHNRVLEKERKMLKVLETEEIPLLNMNMEDSNEGDEGDIRAIIEDYHDRKAI